MNLQRVGYIVASIFLLGLLIHLGFYWILTSGPFSRVWDEEAQHFLELIIVLYTVPLGVIAGAAFAVKSERAQISNGRVVFFVIAVVIWNLLLIAPVANFMRHPSAKIDVCLHNMRATADKAGFFITGILTFLFSDRSGESQPHEGA